MNPPLAEIRPADIADGHARHYAALLSKEELDSPHFRFLLGQLSAASTLAHALRTAVRPISSEDEPRLHLVLEATS